MFLGFKWLFEQPDTIIQREWERKKTKANFSYKIQG